MTTIKQTEANRRNAQRSTGPTTAEGRKVSSQNALKHGLTAREVTVDEAEAKQFAAFRNDMVAELAPHGALEEQLTEEIAVHSWRLRRVFRLEVNDGDDANPLSSLAQEETSSDISLPTLIRYETSITRSRERALHNLERLQARRRGEFVEAPMMVDVTHSTADGAEIREEHGGGAPHTDARSSSDEGSDSEPFGARPMKRVRLVKRVSD
jgi:tellurite resistance protein